jgi:hypothetical protein
MLQTTVDIFLDSTRAVAELVTRTGAAGVRTAVPDPVLASVERMLASMRDMADQAPHLADQIDVMAGELQAKRLSIQAITAELTVLDQQLEILERTLAPLQAWSSYWDRMQRSVAHALDSPAGGSRSKEATQSGSPDVS